MPAGILVFVEKRMQKTSKKSGGQSSAKRGERDVEYNEKSQTKHIKRKKILFKSL